MPDKPPDAISRGDALRVINRIYGCSDHYQPEQCADCALRHKAVKAISVIPPLASQVAPPADVCENCNHLEPHNGPAGSINDACTHPCCNCGYDSRPSMAAPPTAAPLMSKSVIKRLRAQGAEICDHVWHSLSNQACNPDVKACPACDAPSADKCVWKYDDIDDFWELSCGQTFQFTDGGPEDNQFKFCYMCGKLIEVLRRSHNDEDDE